MALESCPDDTTKLRRALTAGYFLQVRGGANSCFLHKNVFPVRIVLYRIHFALSPPEAKHAGQHERLLALLFFVFHSGAAQAARRQPDGSYKAISSGQVARFHPSGALHGRPPGPECVVYTELVRGKRTGLSKKRKRSFAGCSAGSWLM